MEVQPDFRDLLALFNAHKVDYIIVGGYALAFHGIPRYTGDINFLTKECQDIKSILSKISKKFYLHVSSSNPEKYESGKPKKQQGNFNRIF